VISYTENRVYVGFAAVGSWLGAFATITFLHRPPGAPPVGAAPENARGESLQADPFFRMTSRF
jgi:hypothetical protein